MTGRLGPAAFAATLGFPLDGFQRVAIEHLAAGRDVLVAAPTGAGKTVVGEYACADALVSGRRTFYTTPIKALSNQKHRDLIAVHGEGRVGLLTGDRSLDGDAPIVVMTTEVLRNMLYADAAAIAELGHVVLDEVHYLADRERGAVWEEVILQLPRRVRLAALSATVSNAEQFGAWLDLVRGGCALVLEERRPVPLRHHYYVNGRIHDTFRTGRSGSSSQREAAAQAEAGVPNPEVLMLEQRSRRRTVDRRGRSHRGGPRLRWPARTEMAEELAGRGWLPAIVFVFSRLGCEEAVAELRRAGVSLTSAEERDRIADLVDARLWELPVEDLEVLGVGAWRRSLLDGVAAHHAGMIPLFKEIVEAAFQAGLLRIVFATETLALGINMPARSVVIERLEKYDGQGHRLITPGQYTQLTGRAGRRGIDTVGHAIVLHQRDVEFRVTAGLVGARSYPLHSSFAPSYNMVVNLLARSDTAAAEALLRRSFAQFELDAETARDEARLAELAADRETEAVVCDVGDWSGYWMLRRRLTETERAAGRARRARGRTDRAVIEGLRSEMGGHPCQGCPERSRHERRQRELDRHRDEFARLTASIERRSGSLVRDFRRLVDVLTARGHLDAAARPTASGGVLAGLHGAIDLLATEALTSGLFDGLGPAELAGAIGLLLHEPRRDDLRPLETLPTPALDRFAGAVDALAGELRSVEVAHGAPPLRDLDAGLVPAAMAWARGASLEEALADDELTGGDFVRSMKQCIDLLGQIRDVSAGPDRTRFAAAAGALQRGIVAA